MTRQPMFDPNNPERINGVPILPGPSNIRHNVACVEGGRDPDHAEMPGAFEICCTCGYNTWSPWGADHAEQVAKLHLWAVGHAPQRVIR